MRNANPSVLLAAQDGATSFQLPAAGKRIGGLKSGALQVSWGGTLNGTFSARVSNDGTNWVALADTVTASGAPGTDIISLGDVSFTYIQLDWARTGGTGNVDALISGVE